jgi:sortase A
MSHRLAAATSSIVCCAFLVASCSGSSPAAAPVPVTTRSTTTAATVPITTRATTTVPRTTSSSTSTTSTTVLPSTTALEPLSVPLPPPEDARAAEPEVQVGTIEIPKLGVNKTLYSGMTLTTLDRGPGHWPGTALPGHRGNVVIGGHRTSKDKPFRYIDQLVTGDEVVLSTGEGRFVYRVTSTEIVLPDAMWIVDQTETFTATLFACHPVGSTRERIVVFLELAA